MALDLMTLARRAHYAILLLRTAAGFALMVEASLVRLSSHFAAELSTLLQLATATQIGIGLLLIFGILARWVALAAMTAVFLSAWLLPPTMMPMMLLWLSALAAIALLEPRGVCRRSEPPVWRYLGGLARGADIFK